MFELTPQPIHLHLGFVVAVIGFMVTTLIFPRLLRPSLLRNLLPGTRSLVSHRSAYSKRCVVVHEEGKTQQGAMPLCNFFFSLHSTARDYEIEMRAKKGKGQHSTLPSQNTHPTPSFLGASVLKSRLRMDLLGRKPTVTLYLGFRVEFCRGTSRSACRICNGMCFEVDKIKKSH